MSTRGYFTIKNNEEDLNNPYIGKNDILVEAFHDGDINTMINYILDLPKALVSLTTMNNYNLKKLLPFRECQSKEDFLMYVSSFGIYVFTWDSLLPMLQATKFNMYNRIEEGVDRYGSSTDMLDSMFEVKCEFGKLSSSVEIKVYPEYIETVNESFDIFDENGVYEFDLIGQFNDILYSSLSRSSFFIKK